MRKLVRRPRGLVGRVIFFAGGFLLAGAAAASAFFLVTMIYGAGNFALAQASSLSAPTSTNVTEVSATSVSINWSVPDAQIPGTTYEVIRNPGSGQVVVCTVNAPTCTDSGLKPGTAYTFSVVAVLDNWQSTAATISFTTLGVTATSLPDGIYGATYSGSLAATGGNGGNVWTLATGSTPLPPGLTLTSGGALTGIPTAAGTTSGLEFSVTDSNGFSATSGNLSLTVDRAVLTVTASATSTQYGSLPSSVTPNYSGFVNNDNTSSMIITAWCSSPPSTTRTVGTYEGANTCMFASTPNYTVNYVAGNETVTPAPLTVTAPVTSTIYGSEPSNMAPIYSGFQNNDDVNSLNSPAACVSTVTTTSPVDPYLGANTCSGATATNYTFNYVNSDATVTPATLTVTASSTSTTYGSPPSSVTPLYAGFLNSDGPGAITPPTCVSAVIATRPVGPYPGANTCSGGAAANYTLSFVAGDAAVTRAPLTITASSTTSSYGSSSPSVTASYSSFQNNETSIVVIGVTCSSTVTASRIVGVYSGANTCSSGAAANYKLTYVPGIATVTKALVTVTAPSTTTTYGDPSPNVAPIYTGFENGDDATSFYSPATCSSTVVATSPTGPNGGTNTCSGASAPNYRFTYVAGDATVTRAVLTVTASSTTSTYGTAPTVTASYNGFQNSDGPDVISGQSCSSNATNVGLQSGTNICSGGTAANYTITYVPGDATVTRAVLTVTATSTTTSAGTAPTVTPSYDGFQYSDDSGVISGQSCTSTVTTATRSGTYPGANTCLGGTASNYTITYVSGDATVS